MKRIILLRIISFILIIASLFPLAGCGSKASDSISPDRTLSASANQKLVQNQNADNQINDESIIISSPVPSVSSNIEEIPSVTNESVEETENPSNNVSPTSEPMQSQIPVPSETLIPSVAPVPTETPIPSFAPSPTVAPTPSTTSEDKRNEYGFTEEQMNSYSMLYYLTITSEEIRSSKDNRLVLEDIYSNLINEINPGAIDDTTQQHLEALRDIIESYLQIEVKRDRLQYIYNQDKAAAIRGAVPNPIAILSVSSALNWKKLATSVVYTIVDSYNGYKSASAAADRAFIMSGWELDDEETATINRNRRRAFNYMVDIVQEYGLNGKLTLSENDITTFNEICSIEYIPEKAARLEDEESRYKLLGNYWLELADCYFELSRYKDCLRCVDNYEKLASDIYKNDYNYVHILPKAIVAAQDRYSGDNYIKRISRYADAIIENTKIEDWSVRYFAAQVYLDLYSRTNKQEYLKNAYIIAKENVTYLLKEQRKLNDTYINDIKEITLEKPNTDYMTKDDKKSAENEYKEELKRVKAYNKALKEERKTALPPIYEPLALNCDLMFALADKINLTISDKNRIETLLQTANKGIFLSDPINNKYSFKRIARDYKIEYSKSEILIPVTYLTTDYTISVTVNDNGNKTEFSDIKLTEIERLDHNIDSFKAKFISLEMARYKWSPSSKVTITIGNGEGIEPIIRIFKVAEFTDNFLIEDKVVFTEE